MYTNRLIGYQQLDNKFPHVYVSGDDLRNLELFGTITISALLADLRGCFRKDLAGIPLIWRTDFKSLLRVTSGDYKEEGRIFFF
jgi:hypothetical protein